MNITSLGQVRVEKKSFKHIEHKLEELSRSKWTLLNEFQKQLKISELLCDCIQQEKDGFLLRHISDFIEKVQLAGVCEQYNFFVFEVFLNQYLNISDEENAKIRAKIAGKIIPRAEYQEIFPVGMDKYYEGPHFVTAHASPDLDTMVSSFWGWLDAFAARITSGNHFWNIPGGPPKNVVEKDYLFTQIFGEKFFNNFSKDKTVLTITAFDLFTQKGLKVVQKEDLLTDLENEQEALIITENNGSYLADWKGHDAEGYRRITSGIFSILRSFENSFQHQMIQAFARNDLTKEELKKIVSSFMHMRIENNDAYSDLSEKLKLQINLFLQKVMNLEDGVKNSFESFFLKISQEGKQFCDFSLNKFKDLYEKEIFNTKGELIEHRTEILHHIDEAVLLSKQIMETVRKVFATFSYAVAAKDHVLDQTLESISSLSDIEEIKSRIGANPYITVNMHLESSSKLPLGVIYSYELQKNILGTVTCRDFTNKEETKIPAYLEVISGLDHHKMNMNASSPITLKIMDVQSANTLVALEAFKINDKYSFGGILPEKIDELINEEFNKKDGSLKVLQKLIMRKANIKKYKYECINKEREILEYMHFFFAILDDTDLLSKVTNIDIDCIVELVNRLRSLQLGKEVEILNIEDLDRNMSTFSKLSTARILQNEHVYSLYRTIYEKREKEVEKHIDMILLKPSFPLFEDTKVQNGCARVGQKKLYSSNILAFQKQKKQVLDLWVKESISVIEKNAQIDLHMLMISTVASCEDVYKGAKSKYQHQDELWFYIPNTETAKAHLKSFLDQFKRNKMMVKHSDNLKIEFFGNMSKELKICFDESFIPCECKLSSGLEGVVVLYHDAGILNSRKSMISPFLPNI